MSSKKEDQTLRGKLREGVSPVRVPSKGCKVEVFTGVLSRLGGALCDTSTEIQHLPCLKRLHLRGI